jgi:hypothetical protein
VDTTKVGQVAAALMEAISEDYHEDVEIGDVVIVVELSYPPGCPPGEDNEFLGSTSITFQGSDPRGWVQRGLLIEALEGRVCG